MTADTTPERISFGTAGLRAAMGEGHHRMNRTVVQETTAGLMRWLAKHRSDPLVIVGYDARHNSKQFALDVAAVVVGLGGRAELLPQPLPTPVLAAAVLARRADAGVMITASHNPASDNGYKLYLSDGIQLVSPADSEISAEIDAVVANGVAPAIGSMEQVEKLEQSVVDHHLDLAVAALVGTARSVDLVYTAMHGVGGEHLLAAFERSGFPRPRPVPEQFQPDPEFPTVPFPNPEEPGALDLAIALAEASGADGVLANDPDADRLAVAIPTRDRSGFVALTGDQLGVLLADHLLRNTSGTNRVVATSLVSSRQLERLATSHGVRHVVTLTGFKFVARPIVEQPSLDYVLGYEEAIGYCVGGRVRDKDGISAALVAAEMLADAKEKGETMWERLDRLAIAHGLYATAPLNIRLPGTEGLKRRSELLAAVIASPPGEIAGARLVAAEDLADGKALPATPGLLLTYDDDSRVIIRPSGTEPKLKAYIEVLLQVPDEDALADARLAADTRLAAFTAGLRALLQ